MRFGAAWASLLAVDFYGGRHGGFARRNLYSMTVMALPTRRRQRGQPRANRLLTDFGPVLRVRSKLGSLGVWRAPNVARLVWRAKVVDDLYGANRPRGAAGGRSRAQGQQQETGAAAHRSPRAAAMCGHGERDVLDVLLQRERLGSTGIGGGIAIPHGKLAEAR